MSTFTCEVVPIKLEPHPDADSLSLVKVYDYTVVVRTSDFKNVDKAVYIPIDALCPDTPEFAFLGEHRRIKAKQLRGIFSQGLLMPIDSKWCIGDNVAKELGISKYEPPEENLGQNAAAPHGLAPVYTDIEALRKYYNLFNNNEKVVVTEKIHGCNARYTLRNGILHIGSHVRWKNPEIETVFSAICKKIDFKRILKQMPPDVILYGEIYGNVQDLRYDTKRGEIAFRAFDIFDPYLMGGKYLDNNDFITICRLADCPIVPILDEFELDTPEDLLSKCKNLAESNSIIATQQLMEGIVVKPIKERWTLEVGRLVLKLHSQRYLLRKGA